MTIIVLGGGLSHERDVSLRSARRVALALRDRGLEVMESDIDAELISRLRGADSPVVVPMLHGGLGEDGALREVLDLLGIAYVGSDARASRITFDKSVATGIVAEAGVTVPMQVVLPHDIFRELGAAALVEAMGHRIGFPMMVKPSRSGSALGCTRVDSSEQLPAAMVAAYAYGDVAVVEEFIEGTEIAVTVVDLGDGPCALPAVEIHPANGVYDYEARYTAGATEFVTPASLCDAVAKAAADLALRSCEALGLRDVARVDIVIRRDEPVFLEANVAPGMTETSLAPLAMEAAGLDLGDVFARLVVRCGERG